MVVWSETSCTRRSLEGLCRIEQPARAQFDEGDGGVFQTHQDDNCSYMELHVGLPGCIDTAVEQFAAPQHPSAVWKLFLSRCSSIMFHQSVAPNVF